MTSYDSALCWCRERRQTAHQDINFLEAFIVRHFEFKDGTPIDISERWIFELKREVAMLDRQIKAYETAQTLSEIPY